MDERIKQYHERKIRWRDVVLKQLSFYNNLILTLSVAFLTFSFNNLGLNELRFSCKEIDWSITALVTSLILISLSISTGLLLAINRLQDFRASKQINQIRQRMLKHSAATLDESTPDKFTFWRKLTLTFENHPIITMEDCKKYKTTDEKEKDRIKFNFRELRNIAHNLGLKTWSQTKYQTIYFGLGILIYLVSRLVN